MTPRIGGVQETFHLPAIYSVSSLWFDSYNTEVLVLPLAEGDPGDVLVPPWECCHLLHILRSQGGALARPQTPGGRLTSRHHQTQVDTVGRSAGGFLLLFVYFIFIFIFVFYSRWQDNKHRYSIQAFFFIYVRAKYHKTNHCKPGQTGIYVAYSVNGSTWHFYSCEKSCCKATARLYTPPHQPSQTEKSHSFRPTNHPLWGCFILYSFHHSMQQEFNRQIPPWT